MGTASEQAPHDRDVHRTALGSHLRTPVGYRRAGDTVTISVSLPERKTWWRNFTGDGGPVSLHLDGENRTGHAVAPVDGKGQVTVTVRLDN
jgi:hypothetical protein